MILQGYQEEDFIIRTPGQIHSWSHVITTLIALTEPIEPPTDEELERRLNRLYNS